MFKEGTTPEQVQNCKSDIASNGGTVHSDFGPLMTGFSASVPQNFLTNLQGHELIDYIEPDGVVTTQ